MDPDANLREQLELSRKILAKIDTGADDTIEVADMGIRLAQLVEALDGWLTKGGFRPERWDRK